MYGVDELASRVSSFVGLGLLLVAVAQMVRIMASAARRSAREWGLVARHWRRASAARASARRARERFARAHETSDAYGYLRLLRGEGGERRAPVERSHGRLEKRRS